MPRYVVERYFADGVTIPGGREGVAVCDAIVDRNLDGGVTWVQSYISKDKARAFCIYEGPTPESVRAAADRNSMPIERITEVRILNPYFYV